MKIAGKSAILAAGLGVIAASVWIGLCWGHRNQVPGKYGSTLEFRVSAFNTETVGPYEFSHLSPGPDTFSGSSAREVAESGEAPAGFKWLPVSDFYLMETGGRVEPRGILHVFNGRKFLLVADQPGMILTHAADAPAWGVKSVKFTSTNKFGPTVEMIEIELDATGARLLEQFTQNRIHHSVAMIVDGQVVINAGLLSTMRDVPRISFPAGGRSEAERLRDSLMK